MPEYLYQNPKTKEVKSVFQRMSEKHEYQENGVKWIRVFTKPQMSVDSVKIDPYSSKDFAKATKKRGKLGDLYDRSKELSLKRADKEGKDPVQEKYYKDWSKRRRNMEHPDIQQNQLKKSIEKSGFIVESMDD